MEEMQKNEQIILETLRREVCKQLISMKIQEPVYTVILTYSTENGEDLCPWVAVGTAREREFYERNVPEELYLVLWDSEGLEHLDPLEELIEDPNYLYLCESWQQEAQKTGLLKEKAAALMQRLCFALQKEDWSKIFPTTEDFVVVACTPEGDWLTENLSILLPKERYQAFVEKGYVLPGCEEAE